MFECLWDMYHLIGSEIGLSLQGDLIISMESKGFAERIIHGHESDNECRELESI